LTPIKILIAEDHVLIAEMWNAVLGKNREYKIVGKTSSKADTVTEAKVQQPDVVLLDIALSDGSGLDIIPEIKQVSPHTKFLIVSAHTDFPTVKKAFSAGVYGYITKTSPLSEMMQAINDVVAGKNYRCREVQELISGIFFNDNADAGDVSAKYLTKKEKKVAYLLYKGLSAREIAEQLELSSKTIDTHRYNIYQKLQIKKSVQLIKYIDVNQHLFTEVMD
jgi:DNA-binding NarL/FixJ family response regulator